MNEEQEDQSYREEFRQYLSSGHKYRRSMRTLNRTALVVVLIFLAGLAVWLLNHAYGQ